MRDFSVRYSGFSGACVCGQRMMGLLVLGRCEGRFFP